MAVLVQADSKIYNTELPNANSTKRSLSDTIINDYKNLYTSKDRWLRLGVAFGVGGIMANTSIDERIKKWYQDDVRSPQTDKVASVVKEFGNGKITIPVALLASSITLFKPDSTIGNWGAYTSRAYIAGAPLLLSTQVLTGASRPDEKDYNSKWHPFKDSNGVSGHAFMGAVPFLTLAYMYKDNLYIKYISYAASFLTAWSRVNDNAHYASQAGLGWYLAYESVDAVFETDTNTKHYSFTPIFRGDSYGLALNITY